MLKRLFVDNYKSLVNFELKPGSLALLLGRNGSGKTAVAEILSAVRCLVAEQAAVTKAFSSATLTRWNKLRRQTIEMEVEGFHGRFRYELWLDHDQEHGRIWIHAEQLSFDNRKLYRSEEGRARLYRDNYTEGPPLFVGTARSGLAILEPTDENKKLQWFANWLRRLMVVSPDVRRVTSFSESEAPWPNEDVSNFASWYRHLTQEAPSVTSKISDSLTESLDGFKEFQLPRITESTRKLRVVLRVGGRDGSTFPFDFDELSEGQRQIAVLYTLLHSAASQPEPLTLFVDEPDNYVALSEIQPWLSAALDLTRENRCQCVLISHHPEAINYLAPESGIVFSRQDGSGTRAIQYEPPQGSPLSPAEVIARGIPGEP